MNRWLDFQRFDARLLVLFSVVGFSFLRFVLQNRYGLLHVEVAVALVIFVLLCVLLALASRRLMVLSLVTLALILVWGSNAIHLDLFPNIRMRWVLLGLTCLVGGSMYLMREKFFYALLIFNIGAFSVDVVQALAEGAEIGTRNISRKHQSEPRHVLYLILDEHLGLAGFPQDIAECREARELVRQVFLANNFTIYPYAFSNYRNTSDSIRSILSNRLLEKTDQDIEDNQLFERYLAKGYAIRIYQSDYLRYSSPDHSSIHTHTYKAHNLEALHRIPLNWVGRLREVLVVYLQADQFLWGTYQRLLPPGMHPERLELGPLALDRVWPKLLDDLRQRQENTLFFAHLMTPHYPYVYGEDGKLQDPSKWKEDRHRILSHDRSIYEEQYRRYSAQVKFLAHQLDSVFQQLKKAGLFDSMTVVVHGDHGSRIRLLKSSEQVRREHLTRRTPNTPAASRYDYVSEPDIQDLLNRFSTLLAVKLPGAKTPEVVDERGSVVYFLRRFFGDQQPAHEGLDPNSVYLFNADGTPREIPILKLWQKEVR